MITSDHAVIEEVFGGEYGLRDAIEMLNQCVYRGALNSWDKMTLSNQVVDSEEFVCQFSTRFCKFTINGRVVECPEQN